MFQGLSDETFACPRGLGAHNNRDWFQAERDAYASHYMAPARELVSELGPGLQQQSATINFGPKVNKSTFRINRNVHFSKHKVKRSHSRHNSFLYHFFLAYLLNYTPLVCCEGAPQLDLSTTLY